MTLFLLVGRLFLFVSVSVGLFHLMILLPVLRMVVWILRLRLLFRVIVGAIFKLILVRLQLSVLQLVVVSMCTLVFGLINLLV